MLLAQVNSILAGPHTTAKARAQEQPRCTAHCSARTHGRQECLSYAAGNTPGRHGRYEAGRTSSGSELRMLFRPSRSTRTGLPWESPGPQVRGAHPECPGGGGGRLGQRAGLRGAPRAGHLPRDHPQGRRGTGARGGCHVADRVAGRRAVPAPRTGVSPEVAPTRPGPYTTRASTRGPEAAGARGQVATLLTRVASRATPRRRDTTRAKMARSALPRPRGGCRHPG